MPSSCPTHPTPPPLVPSSPQVSASRRGLRNQIKSLWFGKSKEETESAMPGVYTYRSPESQIRQLADAAMMLQDVQLALDNYKLLAGDYRKDKAWKHFAAAQVSGCRRKE